MRDYHLSAPEMVNKEWTVPVNHDKPVSTNKGRRIGGADAQGAGDGGENQDAAETQVVVTGYSSSLAEHWPEKPVVSVQIRVTRPS